MDEHRGKVPGRLSAGDRVAAVYLHRERVYVPAKEQQREARRKV